MEQWVLINFGEWGIPVCIMACGVFYYTGRVYQQIKDIENS